LSLFLSLSSAQAQNLTKLDFGGEPVPLSRTEILESLDQELLLLSESKSRIWVSLKRSDRYLPIIEKALSLQKVPLDFKFLPLSLTNLAPDYRSSNRRGLWRFSENEARASGLKITKDLDERLDVVASSMAAAKAIEGYKKTYGSWTMALAAFLDPVELARAVKDGAGITNFYDLYISENLERNVSVVLAGKILFSDIVAFGYQKSRSWPVVFSSRKQQAMAMDVKTLAESFKWDVRTFKDLNPHILGQTVPAGAYVYGP
jgi:hypothetical protein